MNIERRSAIGLSVAALIGGAFTNVVGAPRDEQGELIELCNELTSIGLKLREIDELGRQSAEEEAATEIAIEQLCWEEHRLSEAICDAPLPRSLVAFTAIARAALAVSPIDGSGLHEMDHCTTKELSLHMLQALAGRGHAA